MSIEITFIFRVDNELNRQFGKIIFLNINEDYEELDKKIQKYVKLCINQFLIYNKLKNINKLDIGILGISRNCCSVNEFNNECDYLYKDIEEQLPENHKAWHSRDPDFQPKGGETLRQFYIRVTNSIERIAKNHIGEVVLIVAHGGVLDCMYRLATKMDIAEKRKVELLNTSLNRLFFTDQGFEIEAWGDVSHLQELKSLDDVDSGSKSVPWLLP